MIIDAPRLADVDATLTAFLDRRVERAALGGAAYHRLWQRIRASAAGGKRIRPRLLLLAHDALGGDDRASATTAAAAFELLHTALLLHDDVLDGDLVRRGQTNLQGAFAADALDAAMPTGAATAWGQAAGLLGGDLLLSAVHALLAEIPAPAAARLHELVDECLFTTAAGEFADVGLALGTVAPDPAGIAQMMRDKTADYSFAAPLRAGALLAGADLRAEADLAQIGTLLGFVYQLRDDLLGVFGSVDALGKPVDGDLREGKRTLLIAHAEGAPAWERVRHLFGRRTLEADDADRLRAALIDSGARARTEHALQQQLDRAGEAIAGAHLPATLRDELLRLARLCTERES